jgi:Spy/CpxP family protein refolding chaperone
MKIKTAINSVVILSFLLLAGVKVYAQGRMQRPDRVEQLKKELSLSDKQVEKVKDIFAKSREQMMNARDENMGDRDAMRKAFQENTDKSNKEIEKILTPAQKKKFKVLKEQWRKQMEERMQNMRQRNN